jgi:hypothetical protein
MIWTSTHAVQRFNERIKGPHDFCECYARSVLLSTREAMKYLPGTRLQLRTEYRIDWTSGAVFVVSLDLSLIVTVFAYNQRPAGKKRRAKNSREEVTETQATAQELLTTRGR